MNNKALHVLGILAVLLGGLYLLVPFKESSVKNGAISLEESGNFLKITSESDLSDYVAGVSSRKRKSPPPPKQVATTTTSPAPNQPAPNIPVSVPTFSDSFSTATKIEETGNLLESSNINWWVNSGAWLLLSGGTGKTIQGNLSTTDRWYTEYKETNSEDTDNGLHPQNIFRLVQSGKWANLVQQAYFKINKLNVSNSVNRNASNGLFLFNRYQSGDNLYYTGVRVDGAVVIKKKMNGVYYTMAYKQFFSGTKYNRELNPNLMPLNAWIGLKSEVTTNSNGTVSIKFYLDVNKTGNWTLALDAIDDAKSYGGGAILNAGYAGIRTDFIDVEFDDYNIHS